MEKSTLVTSKQPNTNCLNKEEHQHLMDFLEERGPTTPLNIYLLHLIAKRKTETFMKLYKANEHLI